MHSLAAFAHTEGPIVPAVLLDMVCSLLQFPFPLFQLSFPPLQLLHAAVGCRRVVAWLLYGRMGRRVVIASIPCLAVILFVRPVRRGESVANGGISKWIGIQRVSICKGICGGQCDEQNSASHLHRPYTYRWQPSSQENAGSSQVREGARRSEAVRCRARDGARALRMDLAHVVSHFPLLGVHQADGERDAARLCCSNVARLGIPPRSLALASSCRRPHEQVFLACLPTT